MQVDLSDRAQALCAVIKEFEQVEAQQIKLGEQMSALLYEQVRLAEKSRILKQTLEALATRGINHVE